MHSGRLVIAKDQNLRFREYDVPEPHPNALVIKQELAGICGTDLHNWQNGFDRETVLGHENVGIIVSQGKEVTTDYMGNRFRKATASSFDPAQMAGRVPMGFTMNRMWHLILWVDSPITSTLASAAHSL